MGFKWNAAGYIGWGPFTVIVIISRKDNGIIMDRKKTDAQIRKLLITNNTAHNRLHSIEAAAREARLALRQPRVRLYGTL